MTAGEDYRPISAGMRIGSSGVSALRKKARGSLFILFAPRPFQPGPGDPGLFGPDSATWIVHGDVTVFLGAIRSLLVQAMHPEVVAGVMDHSHYDEDPLGRLRRTAEWVAQVTYAPTPQAEAAITGLSAAHARIIGVSERGRAYRASDPELLAWVHNSMVESFATAYRLYGPPHDPSLLDDYVAEMAALGARLGATPGPLTLAELTAWISEHPDWDDSEGRRTTHTFLASPPLPFLFRSTYRVLWNGALASVPKPLALLTPATLPGAGLGARAALAALRAVLGESYRVEEARARLT